MKDSIRKTARGLGIQSEAALRFEKGVSEFSVECGMNRALNLIQSLGVAKISNTCFDISNDTKSGKNVIKVPIERINYVLGINVPKEDIVRILNDLNFETKLDSDDLTISIPRYREDIETYQDIAEEIIREYGYDNLIPTFLSKTSVTNGGLNRKQRKELELKQFLCSHGYFEIQTLAMTTREDFDKFLIPTDSEVRKVIELLNPISENLSIMRTLLVPSMVRVIEENLKSGNDELRFFELANVYIPRQVPIKELPLEIKTLCIGSSGKEDFFSIKKIIEKLADANKLEFSYRRCDIPYLHSGRAAEILCEHDVVGYLGQIRYEIIDNLNILKDKKPITNIFVAELNYDLLYNKFKKDIVCKQEFPYNKIKRDISLLFDREVLCGDIMDSIHSSSNIIKKVELFDTFESKEICDNKISMSFSVYLEPDESDETDELIENVMNDIINNLKVQFNAIQR